MRNSTTRLVKVSRLTISASSLSLLLGLVGCGEKIPSLPSSSVTQQADPTPEEKFAFMLKAAEQGDVNAQFNLGVMYRSGDGVPKDPVKAVEWLRKVAEQGNSNAQFNLGVMYGSGDGVQKDEIKAAEWFRKAAEQGDANAQFYLGWIYRNGKGVPKDVTKAIEWYRMAAEQGNAKAQNNLAVMYGKGEGVPKDVAKAVDWYRKAAEQGVSDAQIALGWIYDRGEGVPKDAAKAVDWFRKAAEQGDATGQLQLGIRYLGGLGTPTDYVLSYAWANLAVAGGSKLAEDLRDAVEFLMSKSEIQEAQRLASNWKPGQPIEREGKSVAPSRSKSAVGTSSKQSTGTAFIVGKGGLAISNYHVISGCTELRIEGREGTARVVTDDRINDLALLQIPGEIKASAPIAKDLHKLRQGDEVVVFGFPLNAVLSSGGNLTPGVISALTGLGNNTSQIQITAPIQPGSSGSPVLNKKGEVAGVVSMKLSDKEMVKATGSVGQNVNFAISGQTLKSFLDTHQVDYRSGGMMSFEKSAADLADEARKWTTLVECWR